MNSSLEQILATQKHLWRGRAVDTAQSVVKTGYAALDEALPGGGWPADALVEVAAPRRGMGELRLLLPAMASAAAAGRQLVWIAPPYIPYAPALAAAGIDLSQLLVLQPKRPGDIAWAMEQVLRLPQCGVALAWPGRLKPVMVRRLQLAAERGGSLGILFTSAAHGGLPTAMRLRLLPSSPKAHAVARVEILKSRSAARRRVVDIVAY